MKETKQPEPLRLADALNRAVQQEAPDDDVICVARWFAEDSATELRHLHALNQELLEALKELADLVDLIRSGNYTPDSFTTQPAYSAIAKAPVAQVRSTEKPHKGASNE